MDIQLSGELDESIDALLEPRQAQLLLIIARSDYPLGARELIRRLDGPDKRLSESTVNRLLRQLDQQGLTESLDGRGRVLSKTGRAVAARIAREERWRRQLGSLDIRSLSDVQDLLRARRGIEREVARSVALTATKADIARLRQSIAAYGESIDSERRRLITVDFHKALTEMSDNPILRSAATVLFDTRFDVFEQILDAMTAGRGRTHQGPHEHEEVVNAIERHDPDAAEAAMVAHLNRLLDDASGEVSDVTQRTIERLLREHATMPDIHSGRDWFDD